MLFQYSISKIGNLFFVLNIFRSTITKTRRAYYKLVKKWKYVQQDFFVQDTCPPDRQVQVLQSSPAGNFSPTLYVSPP